MSQVSKYFLPKNVYDHIFDIFLFSLVKIRSKKSASEFLEEFLTPTEKIMFAKRLAVGILLSKKLTYKEISDILKVSTTTIGHISFLYKYGKNYRQIVDQLLIEEKLRDFWLEFGESIASMADIGGAKAVGWKKMKPDLKNKRLLNPF